MTDRKLPRALVPTDGRKLTTLRCVAKCLIAAIVRANGTAPALSEQGNKRTTPV